MQTGNWRLAIYRWALELPTANSVEILGQPILSVRLPAEELNQPFDVQFEVALDCLQQQLNAYVEGDGAFGASGMNPDGTPWKLQGTVFEVDSAIRYAEVWLENCRQNSFDAVLGSLSLNPDQCVIQLMEYGCFLSAAEFSKLAFGEN